MSMYLAYEKEVGRSYTFHNNSIGLLLRKSDLEWLWRSSPEANRIWQRLFDRQTKYYINIAFTQLVAGAKLIIHVSGPFLHKLKFILKEEILTLKLMLKRRTWSLNIDVISAGDGNAVYQSPKDWNQQEIKDLQTALDSKDVIMTLEVITVNGTTSLAAPAPIDEPLKDMGKKALEEEVHWDFELVAKNGVRIRCHKVFLACQSEVFNRMFQTSCVESLENTCNLKQSEETVRAFLKYLYYGDFEDAQKNQKIALDLMQMGHKYDITSLENAMKKIILDFPTASLDVNVALLMFSFALKVAGYEDVKEKATLFINSKPKEVMECEVLDTILQNEPGTAKELLAMSILKP
ncbi:unnamed protein product [Orchesella dallaii]|uniref:BTB domain-containing protein n=1 Tax=Orchesella dallaii TaxID=48710 RepID=A0ABP1RAX9_9HEXA